MHFPRTDEWNLVDLKEDPLEMQSVHDKPAYKKTLADMRAKLSRLAKQVRGRDIGIAQSFSTNIQSQTQ